MSGSKLEADSKVEFSLPDPGKIVSASLDLGSMYTGVSVWLHGECAQTLLLISKCPSAAESSVAAFNQLSDFLQYEAELYDKPMLLVMEDYGYGGGFFNTDQAEFTGMLKKLVLDNSDKFMGLVPIPPNVIKVKVTGNGRATKGDVAKCVAAKGYETSSSHEADSIGVFLTYKEIWESPSEAVIRRSILKEPHGG